MCKFNKACFVYLLTLYFSLFFNKEEKNQLGFYVTKKGGLANSFSHRFVKKMS